MVVSTRTAIALAAKGRLLADTRFSTLIGNLVGSDLTHGAAYPDQLYTSGWVFVGLTRDSRPFRDPSSTGTSSVTVDTYGAPWASPNQHNTAEFPSLRVIVWSDPTRPTAQNGLVAIHDAEDKCEKVKAVIKAILHDPLNVNHQWGNLYVFSCLLGSEQPIRDVAPYDGLVAGELRFNLEM